MSGPRAPIFAAVKAARGGKGFDALEIGALDNILDALEVPRDSAAGVAAPTYRPGALTENITVEIIEHEAIVPEAYKDSRGIWTWGVGVTSASGHRVHPRYKDKPQTIERCLEVYEWLLRTKYLPEVLTAFRGRELTEYQLGGALSFHWNTGAIGKADWVRNWCAGQHDAAHTAFMNWATPKEIIGRRKAERSLFFDGIWTSDGHVTVYDVAKPSYTPRWSSARQVDIRPELRRVVAKALAA